MRPWGDKKVLPMKASILAVGTELTTGQIVNKNAAWLSDKLKFFGITVLKQITVPDDRILIRESLDWLSPTSDLIFVTGGLGPTSDDFTRDLIAEWSENKMTFDESSWKSIQERLQSRGFKVREMQKQQCYFPAGAKVLTNSMGTANGFYLNVEKLQKKNHVFVLPGPPNEIAAIWQDHIQNWLLENTKNLNKMITKSWDTLGVGESDVAELIEKSLAECPPPVPIDLGYRVHLPYVEFKVTFQSSDHEKLKVLIEKIESVLHSITVSRDFEDVGKTVAVNLRKIDFTFYDFATGGFLHTRMAPFLKDFNNWSWKQSTQPFSVDLFQNEDNFLALTPHEADKMFFIFSANGQRQQGVIEAPMKAPLMEARRKQYFAEMALIILNKSFLSGNISGLKI